MSLLKRAKSLFNTNTVFNEVHFSHDDHPFWDKEQAVSHSGKKEIKTITRDEAEAYDDTKEVEEEKKPATTKPLNKAQAKAKAEAEAKAKEEAEAKAKAEAEEKAKAEAAAKGKE